MPGPGSEGGRFFAPLLSPFVPLFGECGGGAVRGVQASWPTNYLIRNGAANCFAGGGLGAWGKCTLKHTHTRARTFVCVQGVSVD